MSILDAIKRLTDPQKRKMNRLYNVMSKCPIWMKYGGCRNMDGKTCVTFRTCAILKAYDTMFVKVANRGESLPYLPGKIDYSGVDRHFLLGKKPVFRQ